MSADPNTAQELQVGQVFEGKYKILRELGRGGFGMVYLAFQEGMDRHVALKVLKSSVTAQAPSAKERFLREVKIISKLKHPNTVTIHNFGETYDGGLYMVLEYVEGETLKQVLKREGAQDSLRAADIARQIARSLAEAHRHGVVHRDLKPANIMITSLDGDDDFVKVLDFGVARLLDPKTDDLTSVGLPEGERELIGTPRYMSPEQVKGESLTGASDIYGLGLMLYEMLCGEPAVLGDTTMGLITQQISAEPLALPHAHSFHPVIQDIVRIAVAKKVGDRFQAAAQMAEGLEQAVFQIRRELNLSGPQTGDVPMSGYHSQMQQMQGNWGSGWQNTPSGNYMPQSGAYDPGMPVGPGFDPRTQSGQYGNHYGGPPGSGQHGLGQRPDPFGSGQWNSGQHQQPPPPNQGSGHFGNGPPTGGPRPGSGQYGNGSATGGPLPGSGQYGGPESGHWGAPSSGQQPGGMPLMDNSGFNEIDMGDDFGTIERDALDPSASIGRSQGMFDRNQHPSSELPPVPLDSRPFDPAPTKPVPPPRNTAPAISAHDIAPPRQSKMAKKRRAPAPRSDETMGEFATSVLKACAFGAIAIVVVYLAFVVVGAVLGSMFNGTSRLMAAGAVAIALPAAAFFGEMSGRDRFRLAEGAPERIGRMLLNTVVYAIAVIIVTSGACSNDVVYELQDEPNWFLSNPESRGFAKLNKRVSYQVADVVKATMEPIGLYDKKKRMRRVAAPGAPGRTKALPQSTRQGNAQIKSAGEGRSDMPEKKKNSDYEKW